MDCAILIDKLVEIEEEVGKHLTPDLYAKLLEAEFCALQLYRDRIEILNENIKLRGALMTTLTLLPLEEQSA